MGVRDQPLRAGLFIPADTPGSGGNARSAARVAALVADGRVVADVLWHEGPVPTYDVYHAWNATRVGAALLAAGVDPHRLVVTWTGTDLGQDWPRDSRGWADQLAPVAHHVVFTEAARQTLEHDAPAWTDRVCVIPPSVDLTRFHPNGPRMSAPHPLFLMAGGIRPVKRIAWGIALVEHWRTQSGREAHLVIAGPIRDAAEGRRIAALAHPRSWVHLVGDQPPDAMPRWYRTADVVLNTSLVEGVSNALMEAMACGALVVASDIPGNRALITDCVSGRIFHDAPEFLTIMAALARSPAVSRGLRVAARRIVEARYAPAAEAAAYARLYRAPVGSHLIHTTE